MAVSAGLLLGLAVAGAWWVAETRSFVRWALERVVTASGGALEIGSVEGTLVGGATIDRLAWRDGGTRVEVSGLSFGWRPEWLLAGELRLRSLRAARIEVALSAGDGAAGEPASLPERIGLPLPVGIDRIAVAELAVRTGEFAAPTVRDFEASLRYRGGAWQLAGLSAVVEGWGTLSAEASVGAQAPFPVGGRARVQPALAEWPKLPPLALTASGSLEALGLRLRVLAPGGEQSLDAPERDPARVVAEASLRPFEPAPLRKLTMRLDGFEPGAIGLPGPRTMLSGAIEASVDSSVDAPAWTGRLALRNALPGPIDTGLLPVAAIETAFAWRARRLALEGLRIDDDRIVGRITVDTADTQALFGRQVPRLDARLALAGVDLAAWHRAARPTRLGGTIELSGEQFEFALSDPAQSDPKQGGLSLAGSARLEGELLRLASLQLRTPAGSLSAAGTAGWQAPYSIDLAGDVERLEPARLARLAGRDLPERAAAVRSLSGEWTAKGVVSPQLALDSHFKLTEGRFDGRPLRLDWRGRLTPDRLSNVQLSASLGDLAAHLSGSAGRPGDRLALELRAPSLAALDPALSGSLRADGEVSLAGFDPDSLAGARVSLRLRAQGLGYDRAGSEPVRVRRASASVDGTLAGHRLEVAVEDGPASGTASAHGGMTMGRAPGKPAQAPAGPAWRWEGMLDVLALKAPIVAQLAAPVPVSVDPGGIGATGIAIVSDGSRLAFERLSLRDGRFALVGQAQALPLTQWAEAFGLLPGAAKRAGDVRLGGQWDLAGSSLEDLDGKVSLQVLARETIGGSGKADLRLDDGRLAGRVDLEVPSLAFAEPAIGPEWAVDGRLRVAAEVSGTLQKPRLNGSLQGRELSFLQRAMGWRLDAGVLDARFDGDRLQVERLRLESAEGSLTMSGSLALEGLDGRFRLLADRLAVPLGPGQRIVVSGETQVTSSATALSWTGRIRADEGLIELRGGSAPSLPDDVVIIGDEASAEAPRERVAPGAAATASPGGATAPPGAAAPPEGFKLGAELEIDLGDKLRVRGRGADVRLAGTLTLRGELPGAPRATGTVRVREGVYSAYGQKLTITRGRVIFNGPLDNPSLDIVAMRRGPAVEAGVAITGTVLSPRIRLVSEPDVPDSQKLSWLVLGVGLDDARSGAQMAALQAAAATLFGSSGGGLTGGLAQSFGLDVLTVRSASATGFDPNFGASFPGMAGSGGTTAANATQDVVAIGKRLGSRVTVTYEQGLRGVWSLLRLQYDLGRRLSVRAQTGTDTAVDLLYGFSFD